MPCFLSRKLLKGNVVRARQIYENNKINKQASLNNMQTKSSSKNFQIHQLAFLSTIQQPKQLRINRKGVSKGKLLQMDFLKVKE